MALFDGLPRELRLCPAALAEVDAAWPGIEADGVTSTGFVCGSASLLVGLLAAESLPDRRQEVEGVDVDGDTDLAELKLKRSHGSAASRQAKTMIPLTRQR